MAYFERVGSDNDILKKVLFAIFTSMHFYRNNTKKGIVPPGVTKPVLIFFATFIINFGEDALLQACD